MPPFTYKVKDSQGGLLTGTMEAETENGVIDSLYKLGYSVITVENRAKKEFSLAALQERFERVTKKEIIIFTRQLATLLRSGVALGPSLRTVSEQTTNKKFKLILENIGQSVQGGESFSDALERHRKLFSELFISMVKVGEAGGMLEQVLDRLANLGTRELDTESRIMSAVIYPLVLVGVAFFVVNFLIIGVLPKFVMVFEASGAELPVPTKIVLGASWILRRLWLPLIAAAFIGLALFKKRLGNEKTRERFHARLLKIPVFGTLYTKIQIARFARITSSLIASGVPILQALSVVENTISNLVIRRAISGVRASIAEGNSLVEPFKESNLFNPMVVQMISTGEKSGNLDYMLNEIAAFYEPEIEHTIKNLTALLEPFMLLFMGLMVAFIALSVLLPIFNLIKVFRG